MLRLVVAASSSCVSARRAPAIVLVLAGIGLATAATVHADPMVCQRAITGATARFAQARMTALQKCFDGVVRGRAGTCPDGQAQVKIAKAGFKLRRVIGKACGGGDANCGTGSDDETLASIGWDLGACPNSREAGATGRSPTAATSRIASSAVPRPRSTRRSRSPTRA